jgi:hypothetical protein
VALLECALTEDRPQNFTPARAGAPVLSAFLSPGTNDTIPSPARDREAPVLIGLRFLNALSNIVTAFVVLTSTPEEMALAVMTNFYMPCQPDMTRPLRGLVFNLADGSSTMLALAESSLRVVLTNLGKPFVSGSIVDCVPIWGGKIKVPREDAPQVAPRSQQGRRQHARRATIKETERIAREHPDWTAQRVLDEAAKTLKLKDDEPLPCVQTVYRARKRKREVAAGKRIHKQRALPDEAELELVEWVVARSVRAAQRCLMSLIRTHTAHRLSCIPERVPARRQPDQARARRGCRPASFEPATAHQALRPEFPASAIVHRPAEGHDACRGAARATNDVRHDYRLPLHDAASPGHGCQEGLASLRLHQRRRDGLQRCRHQGAPVSRQVPGCQGRPVSARVRCPAHLTTPHAAL